MKKSNDSWLIFKDNISLSKELAREILDIAKISIKLKGSFTIVLAGGSSPIDLYKILSQSESNWSKWYIYIGDERCLPLGDKDRNNQIIDEIWLNNSSIPISNINFIRSELGAMEGMLHYERTIENINYFDVVLLSIGEDGHTASLFPGHAYEESQNVVIEQNSPKYPKDRISMSYLRLNKSKNVFKIILGKSKKRAVKLWLQGVILPINQVHGDSEKVYICTNALPNKHLF
jgi:6-phosphogluconolactonase